MELIEITWFSTLGYQRAFLAVVIVSPYGKLPFIKSKSISGNVVCAWPLRSLIAGH